MRNRSPFFILGMFIFLFQTKCMFKKLRTVIYYVPDPMNELSDCE